MSEDTKLVPVLCCCSPENELGLLPEECKEFELRETIDEDGNEGVAFNSNHATLEDLEKVPGFVPSKHKDSKKTWKTWKKK